MDYNVLETRIKFNPNGSIFYLLVLVEVSKGDVRVIEVSQKIKAGYMSISNRTDHVLFDLLQEVSGYGSEITDVKKIPSDWVEQYFQ